MNISWVGRPLRAETYATQLLAFRVPSLNAGKSVAGEVYPAVQSISSGIEP